MRGRRARSCAGAFGLPCCRTRVACSGRQWLWLAAYPETLTATSTPPPGLPELVPSFLPVRYSPSRRAVQSAVLAGCAIWLATGFYACVRLAAVLAATPIGFALLVAATVWLAASLAATVLLPVPTARAGGPHSSSRGPGAPVKQE